MKNNIIYKVTGILLTAASLILSIGVLTFFRTCAKAEDGSYMSCHWAGRAVLGVGCLILLLSIVNLLAKNPGMKAGLSIAMLFSAVLAALLPGRLIATCMMADMRCNAVTRPAVTICSLIIAVVALINLVISLIGLRKERQA